MAQSTMSTSSLSLVEQTISNIQFFNHYGYDISVVTSKEPFGPCRAIALWTKDGRTGPLLVGAGGSFDEALRDLHDNSAKRVHRQLGSVGFLPSSERRFPEGVNDPDEGDESDDETYSASSTGVTGEIDTYDIRADGETLERQPVRRQNKDQAAGEIDARFAHRVPSLRPSPFTGPTPARGNAALGTNRSQENPPRRPVGVAQNPAQQYHSPALPGPAPYATALRPSPLVSGITGGVKTEAPEAPPEARASHEARARAGTRHQLGTSASAVTGGYPYNFAGAQAKARPRPVVVPAARVQPQVRPQGRGARVGAQWV